MIFGWGKDTCALDDACVVASVDSQGSFQYGRDEIPGLELYNFSSATSDIAP